MCILSVYMCVGGGKGAGCVCVCVCVISKLDRVSTCGFLLYLCVREIIHVAFDNTTDNSLSLYFTHLCLILETKWKTKKGGKENKTKKT